ncbi:hypothetical protein [Neomegalonema perideroedes]|uniref:hypothetical protein n=1 Tax=Neomegalonema perideroedes TaxID=217219 RepID=UPI0003725E7A|nr:hypothetical protein [Neomegalonema perideroedes]
MTRFAARFSGFLLLALAAPALSGCGGGRSSDSVRISGADLASGAAEAQLSGLDPMLAALVAQDMAAAQGSALAAGDLGASPERLAAMFANATVASFGDFDRETQIAYHGADGALRIWRAGAETIRSGVWKLEKNRRGEAQFSLSFAREGGGLSTPRSYDGAEIAGAVVEIAEGDVFNLMSGATPFVLPKSGNYETIGALAAKAGIGAAPRIRWSRAASVTAPLP